MYIFSQLIIDTTPITMHFTLRVTKYCTISETGEMVVSKARVLLLGMGIDEQLGGYSRHRYNK